MTGFAVRVLGLTIAGFLIAAVIAFGLLSVFLESYLLGRLDDALKTEALDVVSVLALLEPQGEAASIEGELARLGLTRGSETHFFRVFSTAGEVLATSDLRAWPELQDESVSERFNLAQDVNRHVFTYQTREGHSRVHGSRSLSLPANERLILEVGVDLAETRDWLRRGRLFFGAAMVLVIFLGSLLGYLATRKPLHGVAAVGEAAARHDFNTRVSVPTGSRETDNLALAFNSMVDKIQALLKSQREMTDHIAHDIRSPVARMRAASESALFAGLGGDLPAQVVEDCDQILHLVNSLLEISAAEAGAVTWRKSKVDFSALVAEAAEMYEVLIEQKNQTLSLEVQPSVLVPGEVNVLQRVVGNLLENAAKYTGEGGTITLALRKEKGWGRLQITDTGRGMKPEDLARIFERFFRVDSSRGEPGNGLGLCFCKAAIEALGGKIQVESTPGVGSTFKVQLPLSPSDPSPGKGAPTHKE